jgi:hypothetical protein
MYPAFRFVFVFIVLFEIWTAVCQSLTMVGSPPPAFTLVLVLMALLLSQWISRFEKFTGVIDCQNCPLGYRPGGHFKIWQSQMSPLVVAVRRQRLRIDSSFHIRLGFHCRAPFVVGRSTPYANRCCSAQHCPQIARKPLRGVEIREPELADGIMPTSSASRQRLSERIVWD